MHSRRTVVPICILILLSAPDFCLGAGKGVTVHRVNREDFLAKRSEVLAGSLPCIYSAHSGRAQVAKDFSVEVDLVIGVDLEQNFLVFDFGVGKGKVRKIRTPKRTGNDFKQIAYETNFYEKLNGFFGAPPDRKKAIEEIIGLGTKGEFMMFHVVPEWRVKEEIKTYKLMLTNEGRKALLKVGFKARDYPAWKILVRKLLDVLRSLPEKISDADLEALGELEKRFRNEPYFRKHLTKLRMEIEKLIPEGGRIIAGLYLKSLWGVTWAMEIMSSLEGVDWAHAVDIEIETQSGGEKKKELAFLRTCLHFVELNEWSKASPPPVSMRFVKGPRFIRYEIAGFPCGSGLSGVWRIPRVMKIKKATLAEIVRLELPGDCLANELSQLCVVFQSLGCRKILMKRRNQ